MNKENININQKKFLEHYARTLDAEHSARLAGYKNQISVTNVKKILDDPKKIGMLNKIIKQNADKLEITKAFIVQKYLKIINMRFLKTKTVLKSRSLHFAHLTGFVNSLAVQNART